NFSCFWCQNHHLSHPKEDIFKIAKKFKNYIPPETLIDIAMQYNCQGTSISFNEPTLLFEYSLEVFKLAKAQGLYNTYVTNGYMTEFVLQDLIKHGLDAMNIDIKGNAKMVKRFCGADIENIWRNAKFAKESGVHVEITTLLIENFNTEKKVIEEISQRILNDLGQETPLHLSRFYPQYKSHDYDLYNPTKEKLLYEAYEIAKGEGLEYVYLGNLLNSKYESTYCPNCSELVIKRSGYTISILNLDSEGNCKTCGRSITKI
ncbi:MAG: radical SAM protein, partial [Candidatus Heimdallarchaeota archaeon]